MNKKEAVLCLRRDLLPETWMEPKSVVPMGLDTFINGCEKSRYEFIERKIAETDPRLKQVIPYVILQSENGNHTAVYKRKGSEKRLHDLWSLGVGGHLNPEDQCHENDGFQSILAQGMERELSEELCARPDVEPPVFLGVINEDTTDVGRVHIGAVFQIRAQAPERIVPGRELMDFQWIKTADTRKLTLELWSELALELL